jgi:hypothetical protein
MKTTIIITLLAVAAFALPAHAKLGESRAQLIKRFGAAAIVDSHSSNYITFVGKNRVAVSLSANGYSVAESYMVKTKFSQEDADEIASTVIGMNVSKIKWDKLGAGHWVTQAGTYTLVLLEPTQGYDWMIVVGFTDTVNAMFTSGPETTPSPTPRIEPRARSPKDCLIVATEAFARLSKTAAWARIAGLVLSNNGKVVAGHAVVIYQPTSNSNVFIYDDDGSLDCHTQSHELTEIIDSYNSTLQRIHSSWRASSKGAHWVSSLGDAQPVVAAATPTPAPSPTSAMTDEQVDQFLTKVKGVANPAAASKSTTDSVVDRIVIWFFYAFLAFRFACVVICELKGKHGMAGLGVFISVVAICGAIRIAKPQSWWARRYYGDEKMKIALSRFPSPYADPTRKGVEQSGETINISEKVRA